MKDISDSKLEDLSSKVNSIVDMLRRPSQDNVPLSDRKETARDKISDRRE